MTKKKGGLNRGLQGVANNSISEQQKIILDLLTKDFLTVHQIAKIRGTSTQAVYKTINKLKKKGLIKGVAGGLQKTGGSLKHNPSPPSSDKTYRLHAINLEIQILHSSTRYNSLLQKRNKDEIDNNTLMLYDNSITVYLNKDFWGDTPNECVKLSLKYIEHLIVRLENAYKIVLHDQNKCNIRQCRGHIAKTGDPYAKEINLNNDKIKIYDDLGQLRLLVDKSFNYDELEAVHKDKHIKDMNKINDKWLDLIETDLKLSDVSQHLAHIQQYQKENEEFKNELLLLMKSIIVTINTKE